jgi:hypothetical protein
MSNIREKLALGNAKRYYQVETEFEAVGTFYTNGQMHYTAAHPTLGLWLSANTVNNQPIVIGFIQWSNIKRVVVDKKSESVFIVVNDYETAIRDSDKIFRTMYKKTYTHQMSDSGDLALCLPLDLFTGNIIPYLESRHLVEYKTEKVKENIWLIILYIIALGGLILGFLFKFIF